MTQTRILEVWLGIVGIAAGLAVLLSGILTAEKTQAAESGISITIAQEQAPR